MLDLIKAGCTRKLCKNNLNYVKSQIFIRERLKTINYFCL